MDFGRGTFTDSQFNVKMTLRTKSSVKNTETGISLNDDAKSMFERMSTFYGLKPTDFGKEFVSQGELFVITEIKPSRRSYPISATRVADKKPFNFSASSVVHGLNAMARV